MDCYLTYIVIDGTLLSKDKSPLMVGVQGVGGAALVKTSFITKSRHRTSISETYSSGDSTLTTVGHSLYTLSISKMSCIHIVS